MQGIVLGILVLLAALVSAASVKYKVWAIYQDDEEPLVSVAPKPTVISPAPLTNPNDPMETVLTPRQVEIHGVLVKFLGKHCTLNPQVPPDVGCMEAVSFLFKQIGIDTGPTGIAGTQAGLAFALAHPELFTEIDEPEESAWVISATNTGNGTVEGHTGFYGAFGLQYPGDWAIVSNDSQTGLLREQWSDSEWTKWYTQTGGIRRRIFRVLG